MSGRKSTSRSSGRDATTSTALEEVQQISDSAFTAAEVLTYATTIPPGCSSRHFRTSAAVMVSAREQPAARSGNRTVRSGASSFAVSAMKWTPQNTITSASLRAANRDRARESPTWSATSWTQGTW